MKKHILSLLTVFMTVGTLALTAEEAPTQPTEVAKDFGQLYKAELTKKFGINDLRIGSLTQDGTTAIVVQFDGDITLRQARSMLVDAVETMQSVVQNNPEFSGQIRGASTNIQDISLVIDTYDESKKKEQQFGISSVILNNGSVYFMGISQVTGNEILLHKQPYSNAVIMNNAQKRR